MPALPAIPMRSPSKTSSPSRATRIVTCREAIRESLESLRREAKMDAAKLTAASLDMTESIERNPDAMLLLNSLHTEEQLRAAARGRLLRADDHVRAVSPVGEGPPGSCWGWPGMLLDIGKTQLPDALLQKRVC